MIFTGVPLTLPWMDPEHLIAAFGRYALWGVALIIFAECGVFAILPGDSLLFTMGLLAAAGITGQPFLIIGVVLTLAAILGNVSGYLIGRVIGPPLFRPRAGLAGKIFKPAYVTRTHAFLEQYGRRALIMARFVPIVRTFVTLVAGVSAMKVRHFVAYTAVGALLWVWGVLTLGYFLGGVALVRDHIEVVLILIIVASVAPMIFHLWSQRRRGVPVGDQPSLNP